MRISVRTSGWSFPARGISVEVAASDSTATQESKKNTAAGMKRRELAQVMLTIKLQVAEIVVLRKVKNSKGADSIISP